MHAFLEGALVVLIVKLIFPGLFNWSKKEPIEVQEKLDTKHLDINLDELEFEAQVADTDAFIAKWMAQKTKNA